MLDASSRNTPPRNACWPPTAASCRREKSQCGATLVCSRDTESLLLTQLSTDALPQSSQDVNATSAAINAAGESVQASAGAGCEETRTLRARALGICGHASLNCLVVRNCACWKTWQQNPTTDDRRRHQEYDDASGAHRVCVQVCQAPGLSHSVASNAAVSWWQDIDSGSRTPACQRHHLMKPLCASSTSLRCAVMQRAVLTDNQQAVGIAAWTPNGSPLSKVCGRAPSGAHTGI